ncbi:MAG: DUF3383 family protein [Candidatus Zixiibacteriota bacterium]|nr:MAG: DUF3383 family protein [candidate division Zixibacteria bacterium]
MDIPKEAGMIEEIVNVQISRETTAVSQKGFGTLLILGDTNPAGLDPNAGDPRVLIANSIDDVSAVFSVNDPEYLMAAAAFAQEPKPTQVKIGQIDATASETFVAGLAAVRNEDDDWYGLVITDRTAATQKAVADAVETLSSRKLFGISSNDPNIVDQTDTADSTSIAAHLKANALSRSFVIYHDMGDATGATQPDDPMADAAWMGNRLPSDPGSSTWAFKTLATVPPTKLTPTQSQNARSKNANTYETIGGVNITREGTTGEPEYIDVIRGVDYIQARMTETIFSRIVNLPKIPYTDQGVAIIESAIRTVLNQSIDQGILSADPAPVVSVPKVADVPFNDRANRFLPDVTFSATLQGAIHSVTVQGTVSV